MNPRLLFLILLCVVVSGTAAWLIRGIYDRSLDGQFMVVNGMAEERIIRVVFPSGFTIESNMKSGSSSTMTIPSENRGEGQLRAYAGNELQGEVYLYEADRRAVVLRVNESGVELHTFRSEIDVPSPEVSGWKIMHR